MMATKRYSNTRTKVTVVLLLLIAWCEHTVTANARCVTAFHANHGTSAMERHRSMALEGFSKPSLPPLYNNNNNNNDDDQISNFGYNDDAFGLIFLTALFIENDIPFASTFGILSGIVAASVKNGVISFQPLLPGVTALVALGVARGVVDVARGERNNASLALEGAVCAVSVGWGIVQQQNINNSDDHCDM